MSKSALSVTITRLGSLLIFLILLAIANILWINNSIYLGIVGFLNIKLYQIILFSILLYLGELFFVFDFPLNFPAPIFNAFGGIILVDFIFDMMLKVLSFAGIDLFFVMRILEIIVVVLVFVLAIIVGYAEVFGSVGRKSREKKKKKHKKNQEWEELKEEIKGAFEDAAQNIKKAVHTEEEKPKKKVTKKKTKSGSTKSKSASTQSRELKKKTSKKK